MNSPNDNDQIQKRMSDSQRDGKTTKKTPKKRCLQYIKRIWIEKRSLNILGYHYSKDVKEI